MGMGRLGRTRMDIDRPKPLEEGGFFSANRGVSQSVSLAILVGVTVTLAASLAVFVFLGGG